MKRDMFYQNLNQGYSNPGMYMPPSGYNINTNYQAYGPNIGMNNMPNNYNGYYQNNDEYYERINTLERQVKSLDTRIQKIESTLLNNADNTYMI